MGLFRPTPMELQYGEPIHLMTARALTSGAFRITHGSIVSTVSYHFTGPHGVAYRGKNSLWESEVPRKIAEVCEAVQTDFNERSAAMIKAREYARDKLALPPLFKPVKEGEAA